MTDLNRRVERWLESQWYDAGGALTALRPLSVAFGLAARFRRWTYVRGLKQGETLSVPVVVVGNLTVGGTGKTPLTIWLVEFLRRAGFAPGVISRGYGRTRAQSQPLQVQPDSDPFVCGDEPVLIARRTSAPVIVGQDRVEAGRALLLRSDCNVLIADDGLQHYRLARDIEVLLIDGERRFGNGYCLPAGPLREPAGRADAADFVVCRGGQARAGEYAMSVKGSCAYNLITGVAAPLASFAGMPVRAIAGIAHPQRFFRELATAGLDIEATAFGDHHLYSRKDLDFADDKPVLMTEKDAVKCREFATERFWHIPIEAELPAEFGCNLLQRLKKRAHG